MFAASAIVATAFAPAVAAASNMEEVMNKFTIVFGKNATAVKAWSDEFADKVGRSKRQIAEFASGTQDLLVPIGLDPSAATQMSKDITGLAVDLASFNNMADGDTIRDIHAALTGSGEVMKKYGVIVSEAAIKQELLNQGIDSKAATEQQKVMARWAIILAGTTAAQGDAVRSSGSFANQMKRLWATLEDVGAELGAVILPDLAKLVGYVAGAGKAVAGWVKDNQQLVATILKIVAVVGAVGAVIATVGMAVSAAGVVFGGLATAASAIGPILGVIGTVLGAVLSPIGLVIAAVVALGGYLLYASGVGSKAIDWLKKQFAHLAEVVGATVGAMGEALMAGDITAAANMLWAMLKMEWLRGTAVLKEYWYALKDKILVAWTETVFGLASKLTSGVAALRKIWLGFTAFWRDAWTVVQKNAVDAWKVAERTIAKGIGYIMAKVKGIDYDDLSAQIDAEYDQQAADRDNAYQQTLAESDQQRRDGLSEIDTERDGAIAALNEERQQRRDERQRAHDGELAQAEKAVQEAEAEWKKAIGEAKKGKAPGKTTAGDGSPGVPDLKTPDLAAITEKASGVTGMFSGFAAMRLGGNQGPAERAAKAAEKTAEGVEELVRRAKQGKLVFT